MATDAKNKIFIKIALIFLLIYIGLFHRYVISMAAIHFQREEICDGLSIISSMFPQYQFEKHGRMYFDGERNNYYIESILYGSYVNRGRDEFLVIVRKQQVSHSEMGLYMAVFDNSSGKIVSGVKFFRADESIYRIFVGQDISYIFIAGYVGYTGWANWYGGLWQAGPEWSLKFPENSESEDYYDFWENRAVDLCPDGIKVLTRRILPFKYKGQVIPDYTWEYSYKLIWNKEDGNFVKDFEE